MIEQKQLINLKDLGVRQKGNPDLLTVYEYHPEVISGLTKILTKLKLEHKFYWIDKTNQPEKNEIVSSGYRDVIVPGGAKNSPHFFAAALDLIAPTLEEQVWIGLAALADGFRRCGLYPYRHLVHIDICDEVWQAKYGGTPAWVELKNGKYKGFATFAEATEYARKLFGK